MTAKLTPSLEASKKTQKRKPCSVQKHCKHRTLLRGLTSAQLISRTSWGEPAGANSDIKMIFKTTLSSIKHSCRTNSRKRFRGVVCLESGGQHSQVNCTIRTYTKSVECAAKIWIRKSGSNKVPQVGASNVVREASQHMKSELENYTPWRGCLGKMYTSSCDELNKHEHLMNV